MTLRKRIPTELLPVLAMAQWSLAANVMRQAYGGDYIARAALPKFRQLATHTDDLVELQRMTGSDPIYVVAFRNDGQYWERDLIDWAVEFAHDSEPDNEEVEDLYLTWQRTEWEVYGK